MGILLTDVQRAESPLLPPFPQVLFRQAGSQLRWPFILFPHYPSKEEPAQSYIRTVSFRVGIRRGTKRYPISDTMKRRDP